MPDERYDRAVRFVWVQRLRCLHSNTTVLQKVGSHLLSIRLAVGTTTVAKPALSLQRSMARPCGSPGR